MQMSMLRVVSAAVFGLIAITSTVHAQDAVRLRGTVVGMDGPMYMIKLRDGSEAKVSLADNAFVVAIVKASLADTKQGVFVVLSQKVAR